MNKQKLLLTGFEKFADYSINPTQILVKDFESGEVDIQKVILPVDFKKNMNSYSHLLKEIAPDFILNLGLNANATSLNIETFAINFRKDLQPEDSFFEIEPNGESALRTTLDTDELASTLRANEIPAVPSHYAGTYLCNFIYYQSLKWTIANGGEALFVHLPFTSALAAGIYSKERRDFPSLSKEVMLNGIQLLVRNVLTPRLLT